MKTFTRAEILEFLKSSYLQSKYDVRVPVRLHDGTRSLGRLDEGNFALAGGPLPMKPTMLFAPQMEMTMRFSKDGKAEAVAKPKKPILAVGFVAADLESLEFIDKFYSANFSDKLYFAKRDDAVIIGISGRCGHEGKFMRIASGKCDFELIGLSEDQYFALPYSEKGKEILKKIKSSAEVSDATLKELQEESANLSNAELKLIQKASQLILDNKVPDEFWQSIADRCIACTACTLLCPTCTCFDVFDRRGNPLHAENKNRFSGSAQIPSSLNLAEAAGCEQTEFTLGVNEHCEKRCQQSINANCDGYIERCRILDSCQLAGFGKEASGHNPMAQEWIRTRRRIHHKLAADPTRWRQITCLLCGRCDQSCPTGIGIVSVCREMVAKYAT